MAILNPDHLFEQAEKLIGPSPAGRPRQVDVRRAISSAYYGLFHFVLTEVADEFVGVTQRASDRYALVYRSINHNIFKQLCSETKKTAPSAKYAPYFPAGGFDQDIQAFAAGVVDLQEKRHIADYNPQPRLSTSEARLAIGTARSAVLSFRRADLERRKAFLTLLLCPPRA
jgi:hypothetical protein